MARVKGKLRDFRDRGLRGDIRQGGWLFSDEQSMVLADQSVEEVMAEITHDDEELSHQTSGWWRVAWWNGREWKTRRVFTLLKAIEVAEKLGRPGAGGRRPPE